MMSGTVTRRARFPYSFDYGGSPYPPPAVGAALRIAFVGQSTYFRATSLDEQSDRVRTTYVEFREGRNPDDLMAALRDHDPHVVIVFRPELIPPGLFHGQRFAALGFLTEPLPRIAGARHPDLDRRLHELRAIDQSNFDRVVAFDPLFVETAEEIMPVWRSLPLPVADRYYRDVRPITAAPHICFVGRSTQHRERFLLPIKHEFDILHLAFGVDADRLEAVLDEHDVTINLHNEPYESFENRVCIHLAAGHLVISERLNPRHGLEPGIDYIEIGSPDELLDLILALHRWPGSYDRVRVRGRMKAEQYRASEVYPRLMNDLYLDLARFGTGRG
ncbi:MAG TPA: hypothetical protein VH300_14570 [Thermoleophilaceae bacterium]|nr:hypothetical protein [Thermoleophilaceae bacterium]